jgi:ribA/ribD-fused uncharacterized protein
MITFWRTRDEYGFLSNFSKHPVVIDGKRYETTEHYYQAMKATNDDDHEAVRTAKGPKKSKETAYAIALRPDWEDVKYDVMKTALRHKAEQYEFIKQRLIDSGEEELAEDSPKDWIWGLGADGTGQNLLGKAWMEIRQEIQERGDGGTD